MSSAWHLLVAMPCMSNGVLPVVLVMSNWYCRPCTPTPNHHDVWWFLYALVDGDSGRGGCGGDGGAGDFLFFHTETTWNNCDSAGCLSFGIVLHRQRGATKGKGLMCNFDSCWFLFVWKEELDPDSTRCLTADLNTWLEENSSQVCQKLLPGSMCCP